MEPAATEGPNSRGAGRPASARSLFLWATITLAGIAVASAVALAILAGETSAASRRVGREMESVRSMASVQRNVLVYSRESLLLAETGEHVHAANRDTAQERLTAALETALRATTGPTDEARVREIDALIGLYIEKREEFDRPSIPTGRQTALAAPYLDDALLAAERYVADSERSAMATEDHIRRLALAVTAVSLALVALLPIAVFWFIRFVRGRVYLPFLGLHGALARYSAGETGVRVGEGGPPEVADMARSFNRMADSLEQQRRTRFEFLMAVAHDLRNPLAALKATVALTEARMRKGELTREQLEQQQKRLSGQVDRLNRMVGDLLDMTRVEAGRFDLELAVCDVRSLAEDARDLFEEASAEHPIRIFLPEEPVPVSCDRQRLGQVLDNLVSNAIKYSPRGGEIDVRVASAADEARIEVQDHGSGIARKDFGRIFEPFQRLQRDRAPGVGLGLSVAKRLVEAQGGRIELESEVGVGSTFRVCLPLASAADAPACSQTPTETHA